jgi:hypothetical protein
MFLVLPLASPTSPNRNETKDQKNRSNSDIQSSPSAPLSLPHSSKIDWPLIEQFLSWTPSKSSSYHCQSCNHDNIWTNVLCKCGAPSSLRPLQDLMISPWYNPEYNTQLYHVKRMDASQSPSSKFPHPTYTSYSDYFIKKYHVDNIDPDQPLVEVEPFSTAAKNYLKPRQTGNNNIQSNRAILLSAPSTTQPTVTTTSSASTTGGKGSVVCDRCNDRSGGCDECRGNYKLFLVPSLCCIHPLSYHFLWYTISCKSSFHCFI